MPEGVIRAGPDEWEIPVGYAPGMRDREGFSFPMHSRQSSSRVPCSSGNVATLPGIVRYSLGMPDLHWGYGFLIGGVAAFSLDEGVISPGGVGFDINCGVRSDDATRAMDIKRPRAF